MGRSINTSERKIAMAGWIGVLGLGISTLKSDLRAELSLLQFFLHPKNCPEAPRPLTLGPRVLVRHGSCS